MMTTSWNRDTETVLFDALDRCVVGTRLRFILGERTFNVGASAAPPEHADHVIRVRDAGFARAVLVGGNLGLGESFMSEGWAVESGSLEGFLTVLAQSGIDEKLRKDPRLLARVALMRVQHAFQSSRENISLHYDLGDEVYDAFLDEARTYTCGYQKSPDETLAQIQENKFDRICEKLQLQQGDTLFDIGCGYGGLVIHAARKYGARTHGITVSKVQAEGAMRRVRELGLEGRVKVEFGDFRAARGVYDKVASVGMFEHLYPHEYPTFFKTVNRLLNDDGIALLHTMGCYTEKNSNDPFTQKYLFPGSTHPTLSSIARQIEKLGTPILDVENIGRNYLPTVRHWLSNFRQNQHRLDPARYDARFQRMFEYYLAMCVAACDAAVGSVFQVLFTRNYRKYLRFQRV